MWLCCCDVPPLPQIVTLDGMVILFMPTWGSAGIIESNTKYRSSLKFTNVPVM